MSVVVENDDEINHVVVKNDETNASVMNAEGGRSCFIFLLLFFERARFTFSIRSFRFENSKIPVQDDSNVFEYLTQYDLFFFSSYSFFLFSSYSFFLSSNARAFYVFDSFFSC